MNSETFSTLLFIFIFLGGALVQVSCTNLEPMNPKTSITEQTETVKKETENIAEENRTIKKEANQIQTTAEKEKQKPHSSSQWLPVIDSARTIDRSTRAVRASLNQLQKASNELEQKDEVIKEVTKQNKMLQEELKKKDSQLFNILLAITSLSIASGVFVLVFMQNMKLGTSLIASGMILSGAVYILTQFAVIFAILSTITILGSLAYVAYDHKLFRKAFEETSELFDDLKDLTNNKVKETIKQKAKEKQSLKTKEIVSKTKIKRNKK